MYELDLVLMLSFNMRRSRIFPKGGGGGSFVCNERVGGLKAYFW